MDLETARETIAAEPPRRLRLDELLRELGAREADVPTPRLEHPQAGARAGHAPRDAQPPHHAVGAGQGHDQPGGAPPPDPRPESLTVGALVDKAAEGGFGFLIGVLALIAIPFFGLSTPFGLAIALLGAQLMLGRLQPWLPARARRRALSMAMLDRVLGLLTRRTRWLAKLSRRRWEHAIRPRLIGLGVVLLAVGLALPLPIPGSNLVFLVPLFLYSLGILERDGAWIVVGYVCTLINIALLVVFGATVLHVVVGLWHWIT